MTPTASAPRGAILAASLLLLVLAGCSPVIAPAEAPTVEPQQSSSAAEQPGADSGALDAAAQLIDARWQLLSSGDWAGVCGLYSTGFIDRLIEVSGTSADTCEAALADAAQTVVDVLADADANSFVARVPYYYVPSSISVDETALVADSDRLVYVPGTAVTSGDPREFLEGAEATPGWLTESVYIQLDDDGVWRYIAKSERK